MPGKNPHHPEGKADADNERMQAAWMSASHPHDKARAEMDREQMERSGGPTRFPAEEQVGGSRPGVPSRVKDAIAQRQDEET